MKIRSIALAALLGMTITGAQAGGTITLNPDVDPFGATDIATGSSTDGLLNGDWTFTLGTLGANAGAYQIFSFAVDFDQASGSLAGPGPYQASLTQGGTFSGLINAVVTGSKYTFNFANNLTNGAAVLHLQGFGANDGTIKMTATAVPEPESYAMMLAGLGALGFMGRRRKIG